MQVRCITSTGKIAQHRKNWLSTLVTSVLMYEQTKKTTKKITSKKKEVNVQWWHTERLVLMRLGWRCWASCSRGASHWLHFRQPAGWLCCRGDQGTQPSQEAARPVRLRLTASCPEFVCLLNLPPPPHRHPSSQTSVRPYVGRGSLC